MEQTKERRCEVCRTPFIPRESYHRLCGYHALELHTSRQREQSYAGELDDDAPGGYELVVDWHK